MPSVTLVRFKAVDDAFHTGRIDRIDRPAAVALIAAAASSVKCCAVKRVVKLRQPAGGLKTVIAAFARAPNMRPSLPYMWASAA